ncbi:metal-dependent hydrolase [Actinomadura violacea]|uniref:Metal-dependent hydrolase n=1 Tax=Actinomadura violacea TaxID=2819934 RepID=A0ABS3RXX5_9ACTN|nr:metal-dependent hydrolase [Actinomadura violacea]MBO2461615.1 metal-dependent hydrolase [Actinomadura violacea]
MGRTHALTGATVFAAAAPAVAQIVHLTPLEIGLGVAATAGFAVLPDIDHQNSGVTMTFGPATRMFSALVRWLSGGHRNGTHSFLGVAVVTFAAFGGNAAYSGDVMWLVVGAVLAMLLIALGYVTALTDTGEGRGAPAYKKPWHGPAALATTAGLAAVFTAAAKVYGDVAGKAVLAALLVLALASLIRLWHIRGLLDDIAPLPITWALMHFHVDLRVVPVATMLGALTHIAGDMVTPGGCPLGWPWSQTMRGVDLIEVNGEAENGPVYFGFTAALAAAMLLSFGPWGLTVAVLPLLAPRPKRRDGNRGDRKPRRGRGRARR